MKLVTVAEMQAAEREAGVPVEKLMENAGLAVAQEAWLLLGEIADRRIVVLAGPGNNGGDGLVAARHMRDWGADVSVAQLHPRGEGDANLAQLVQREVPLIDMSQEGGLERLGEALAGAELVIDALLGTGRSRPIEGALADVLDRLRDARGRRLPPRLLAVDLPTGLDADTGRVDPRCIAADQTVALGWSKVGLHVLPGAAFGGRVEVVDIGIPASLGEKLQTELMTDRWAREMLPERPPGAHKGTFGSALVVAGSPQYTGAAYLACMGALRSGAGIVTLACARAIYPILASKLTETTFEPLDDTDGFLTAREASAVRRALSERVYKALLIGPGMGQGGYPQAFLSGLLPHLSYGDLKALVIDADGLNNLSRIEGWPRLLGVPAVLTPHTGEMSRLSGIERTEIQDDRLAVARRFAGEWGVSLVLKGANTIVAAADGRARISPFANPALATGGTGDVLAGVITGLIAQGTEPFDAASLGVYLHGLAAEHLRAEVGAAGAVAGDLLPLLPKVMKELRGENRLRAAPGPFGDVGMH
ncbi:MAG: NAD(P)H-hydrate dehydratase [Chloroflexi bacterium]|nr:MAG: NAD(P)H-hydrate dehydratase [Chloroflexota bacterium]